MKRLANSIRRTLIVAYKEDTTHLRRCLAQEGLPALDVRKAYSQEELLLPSQNRCLLTHAEAWQIAAGADGLSLIVEADFVPCQGLGAFRLPMPENVEGPCVCYLYAIGPVIYGCSSDGYFWGHSGGAVAYIINARGAQTWLHLLEAWKEEKDLSLYQQWDVQMQCQLRWRYGTRIYLSSRSYGEHGGIPNREHGVAGIRGWHQADALRGPLAFLPAYAQGSRWRYWAFRARSRLRYIYKFAMGKYFDGWVALWNSRSCRRAKLRFAAARAFG